MQYGYHLKVIGCIADITPVTCFYTCPMAMGLNPAGSSKPRRFATKTAKGVYVTKATIVRLNHRFAAIFASPMALVAAVVLTGLGQPTYAFGGDGSGGVWDVPQPQSAAVQWGSAPRKPVTTTATTTSRVSRNTLAAAPVADPPSARPAVAEVSVVPLKQSKMALLVEATINNRSRGTFIVDTGATYTSISREMADDLGLDLTNCDQIRITTVNGRIYVPKVMIDRLSINGLEARNVEATVIDVPVGSSFTGLLGLSFIKQFKLTIDPAAGELVFHAN
jgi:clan AA aspartic protease (TIGR02281 family)